MKLGRILMILGALLLFATAAFHSSGGAMVSGWLEGDKGRILRLLWYVPAVDWIVVGLLWLVVAWLGDRRLAPLVWISGLIPAAVALMLIAAVGAGFPGIWMLIGAVLLAVAGSSRLHRIA